MSKSRQGVGMDSPTWGEVRRRWANFGWDLRAFLSLQMLDLIFIALTIVFFLVAIAYVHGCEKLQ